MKVKKDTKLKVVHRRKGTFIGFAEEDFDTETTDFYPIRSNEIVQGVAKTWQAGEVIPCRASLCTIEIAN